MARNHQPVGARHHGSHVGSARSTRTHPGSATGAPIPPLRRLAAERPPRTAPQRRTPLTLVQRGHRAGPNNHESCLNLRTGTRTGSRAKRGARTFRADRQAAESNGTGQQAATRRRQVEEPLEGGAVRRADRGKDDIRAILRLGMVNSARNGDDGEITPTERDSLCMFMTRSTPASRVIFRLPP